jgi:hypothetical protein
MDYQKVMMHVRDCLSIELSVEEGDLVVRLVSTALGEEGAELIAVSAIPLSSLTLGQHRGG